MSKPSAHPDDPHYLERSGWLRAAVLGGNDGIISVSALIVGIAASGASPSTILMAGIAGLSAGATSMAAGEYVSVSSQSDIERADILREAKALSDNPEAEYEELVDIYRHRGLSEATARQVATELTEKDQLEAHLRDELGLVDELKANPFQAAMVSALSFIIGAGVPLLSVWLAPPDKILMSVLIATILSLTTLGAIGAKLGGAPIGRAIVRVVALGLLALAVTFGVGTLFNVSL